MSSVYPGALDTLATNKANATAQTTDHPAHHNDLADAVNKVEAELGVDPAGAAATVAARILAVETGDLPEFAAKGDLLAASGDNAGARLAAGTNGQVLTADSTEALGVKWAVPDVTQAELDAVATGVWLPIDHGLKAWNFDPVEAGVGQVISAGYVYVMKVPVRVTALFANLLLNLTVGGTSPTTNQCLAGVYSSAGTLLGKTADQSTSWNSSGLKTMALTAEGGQSLTVVGGPTAFVFAAFLWNGGTGAAISRTDPASPPPAALVNVGLTNTTYRWGYVGPGNTALPASLGTLTSTGQTSWVGLS